MMRKKNDRNQNGDLVEIFDHSGKTLTMKSPSPLLENMRIAPGCTLVDRYEILSAVGAGGMGKVYKAKDLVLNEDVALKFLRPSLLPDAEMVERFYSEVRLARQVSHDHVCRVHDIGDLEGHPFLSMEYVDGGSLFELLKSGEPLKTNNAMTIALQLCWGLAAIHGKGIVHRDLKPGNVMLDREGNVKITDFGLAGAIAKLGDEKTIMGTPRYMAPEQWLGKSTDEKSDLYSLGLILYELYTGRPAFRIKTMDDLRHVHMHGADPPIEARPDLASAINDIIMQCLAYDPLERPTGVEPIYVAIAGFRSDFDRLAMVMMGDRRPPLKLFDRLAEESSLSRATTHTIAPYPESSDSGPFIFGRAVWGDDFLGRDNELQFMWRRIDTIQSTLIVGGDKSGKSSLLKQINHKYSTRNNLEISWFDATTLSPDDDPIIFWEECLEPLESHPEPEIRNALQRAIDSSYARPRLQGLFRKLAKRNQCLALLIDDFDQLVAHPRFNANTQFFALVRSLCINSGSLSIAATSRLSERGLRRLCPAKSDMSSLFNFMPETHMKPFDQNTIDKLIARGGDAFNEEDRRAIKRLAGRHPYLVQTMAGILHGTTGEKRRYRAAAEFYPIAAQYFKDLWQWKGLGESSRTLLLILGMATWAGRALLKRDFSYNDIGHYDNFRKEMTQLQKLGLAERLDTADIVDRQSMVWHEQRWSLGMDALSWWIWELVVEENHGIEAFKEWLNKEGHTRILTTDEWTSLHDSVLKTPPYANPINEIFI